MRTCCVKECEISKYIALKYYALFDFPLDDKVLLKKWIDRVNQPDLMPARDKVCSIHFANDDIIWHPKGLAPSLKPAAVPTIFPARQKNSSTTQNCPPTFSLTVPIDTPLQSANKESNANCTLMLIPAQCLFGGQASIPCVIPQFLPQFLQNEMQTQLVATVAPQNLLQPLQFPQIDIQTPGQPMQLLPQLRVSNSIDNDAAGGGGATETSVTIAQVPQPQFASFNLQTPGQPIQILRELEAVDSIDAAGDCEATETSVTIAQIPQPNGHDFLAIPESPEAPNPAESQEINLRWCSESEATSSASTELADNENTQNQAPVSPRKPEKPENWKKNSEEPRKAIIPEAKFPLKPNIFEQEIHVNRVLRPDFLIIPKKKNLDDFSKVLEHTKKPILRISINKLWSESKCSSEGNSSEEQNCPGKSVTIKNNVTQKSVIFRLDPSTGDIIEEKRDIVRSPMKKRLRNRRKKPKVHTRG